MVKNDVCYGGIIVAAGLSSRMGKFKPLLPYADSTIIERSVENLQQQTGVQQIIVVVGYRGAEIEAILADKENTKVVYNPNYRNGDMLESFQVGLGQIQQCDAAYFLPGDMPAISPETFQTVRETLEKTGAKVVFPTFNGEKKHPPLIRCNCFSAICNFRGKGGLRLVLQQFDEYTVYAPVNDLGCTVDADTPEEYNILLRYQEKNKSNG
ncbi:MAG: hypothetical protein H6Q74_1726 [Firmicutes bacterium]|nr:hypothetical protein [Bacillota bacterium]